MPLLSLSSQSRDMVSHQEGKSASISHLPSPSSPMLQKLNSRLRAAENSGVAFLHPAPVHRLAALPQAQKLRTAKPQMPSPQFIDGEEVPCWERQAEKTRGCQPNPALCCSVIKCHSKRNRSLSRPYLWNSRPEVLPKGRGSK